MTKPLAHQLDDPEFALSWKDLAERAQDEDHFYGAWDKGGGRAAPSTPKVSAALSKKLAKTAAAEMKTLKQRDKERLDKAAKEGGLSELEKRTVSEWIEPDNGDQQRATAIAAGNLILDGMDESELGDFGAKAQVLINGVRTKGKPSSAEQYRGIAFSDEFGSPTQQEVLGMFRPGQTIDVPLGSVTRDLATAWGFASAFEGAALDDPKGVHTEVVFRVQPGFRAWDISNIDPGYGEQESLVSGTFRIRSTKVSEAFSGHGNKRLEVQIEEISRF